MASSFKKKSSRGRSVYPAGSKVSLHNNQLLVSTGVPSLDSLLGGGVAVGTVLLLEEDNYGCYAKTLTKCFLAEGVASGHCLSLATADVEPVEIWKRLPCPVDEVESTSNTTQDISSSNDMKIAWRYQNMPKVQSNQTATKFGHFFDFSKTISEERMSNVRKFEFYARTLWSEEYQQKPALESFLSSTLNPVYKNLLSKIQKTIEENGFSTSNREVQDRTILRIVLQSLESPMWCDPNQGNMADHSLPLFLYYLRGILRSSYAVCVITLPTYVQQDVNFSGRVQRLCDTVIRLESFAGSDKETNPIYKEYNGLFHLVRLPRLNSLTCHMPESLDLAFKQRRKKFVIEKLHLPPDISENKDQTSRLSTNTGTSCGASLAGSKLDF